MAFDPLLYGWLAGIAGFSALLAVAALSLLQGRGGRRGYLGDAEGAAAFLFDGEVLVDATPAGRALLPHSPLRSGNAWLRLSAWLTPRFPGLGDALGRLPSEGRITLASLEETGPQLMLVAEQRGGMTHIRLAEPEAERPRSIDWLADRAAQEELETLRAAAARAPLPIWRESARSEIVWANLDYLDLAMRGLEAGAELGWPLPQLFGAEDGRIRLDLPEADEARWFELSSRDDMAGRVRFAVPADATVQAEVAMRSLRQTLTTTFADLSVGLAIFDQARKLVMFNPALMELTGLPPEFLAVRPTLSSMLDAMREKSMLPEPRDYRGWRKDLNAMEQAAANGLYEEI